MYLPPRYLERERNAQRDAQVDDRIGAAFAFAEALKDIDPRLELVLCHEGSDDPTLISGYWHVRLSNFPEADSYMPITGLVGEYAEPSDWHLDQLRERDLWRSGAIDKVYARIRARESAQERAQATAKEERVDEIATLIRARDRVSLHVKRDV